MNCSKKKKSLKRHFLFEKIKTKHKKEIKWLLKPHFKAFGLQQGTEDNGTVVNYIRGAAIRLQQLAIIDRAMISFLY